MPDETPSGADSRSPVLAWTLRVAAVTLVLGCAAAHGLSRLHPAPERGAQVAAARVADPETTGSIAGSAASVFLDPCAVVGRLRAAAR